MGNSKGYRLFDNLELQIIEQSPLPIEIYDMQGNLIKANTAFLDMWKVELSELRGSFNIFKSKAAQFNGAITYIRRAYLGESLVVPELEYCDWLGKGDIHRRYWLKSRFFPLLGSDDKPCFLVIQHEDISARKRTEKKRGELEAKNRALSEATFEAVFISENGYCMEANNAACSLFGYSYEELVGMYIPNLFSSSSRQLAAELTLNGEYEPHDVEGLRRDGSTFYAEIQGKAYQYHGRQVQVTAVRDIRERKRAEHKLHEQEQLLSSINSNIGEGIFRSTPDGKLIYVNPAFASLFGFRNSQEALMTSAKDLYYHPERRRRVQRIIGEMGFYKDEEILFKRQDGSTFWANTSGILVTDALGNEYYDGAIHNIDELKQKEKESNQLINDLVKQNQHLQEFSSIISHNLRKPVVNILGLSGMLDFNALKGSANAELIGKLMDETEGLDRSLKDLNHILALKNDITDQSQQVGFEPVYHKTMRSLDSQICKVNASVEFNFADAPDVMVVPSYLDNVFFQLLSNAVKYRSADRALMIKLRSFVEEDHVVLVAEDNGLGIDLSRNQNKIFNLYSRFHQHIKGRGLGLHILKTQLETIGGRIEVKSQPGQGSCFKIYFKRLNRE